MKRNCFAWATCLALIAAMAAGAAAERPLDNLPVYTKANAPKTPSLEELPLKESVSQYGITWTSRLASASSSPATGTSSAR